MLLLCAGALGLLALGAFPPAINPAPVDGMMPDLMRLFLDPSSARQAGAAMASMLIYVVMAAILAFRPAGLFPVRR